MPKIKNRSDFCSKVGLKYRGWTPKAIEKFLGKPDKTAPNPYSRRAGDVQLYSLGRVCQAEASQDFKAFQEANKSKISASRKAVETKRAKILQYAGTCRIKLKEQTYQDLVKSAVDAYNWRRFDRIVSGRLSEEESNPATENSDPVFLKRIMVNHLRHEFTCYEEELAAIAGRVGCQEAYKVLNRRIQQEIARVYPYLSDECQAQYKAKFGENLSAETAISVPLPEQPVQEKLRIAAAAEQQSMLFRYF